MRLKSTRSPFVFFVVLFMLALMPLSAIVVTVARSSAPLAIPSAAPSTTGDWPMYGHDPSRTNYNPDETTISTANVNQLVSRWQQDVNSNGTPTSSGPAVANGKVYVGSSVASGNNFFAFDAVTGGSAWSANLGYYNTCFNVGIGSTAAISGSVVVIGGGDQPNVAYYGLDANTGVQLWREALNAGGSAFTWASPLIANGRTYLGVSSRCDNPSVRGEVRGLDYATGTNPASAYFVNSGQAGGGVWNSPALSPDGSILVAATGEDYTCSPCTYVRSIVTMDPATMNILQWNQQGTGSLDQDWGSTPIIFHDSQNRTLVGAHLKSVGGPSPPNFFTYVLTDVVSGPIWQRNTSLSTGMMDAYDPTLGSGGTLFIFGGSSTLYAVDPATGTDRWSPVSVGSIPAHANMAVANGLIFLNLGTNGLQIRSEATGSLLRTLTPSPMPAGNANSGVAVSNGFIYWLSGSYLNAWSLPAGSPTSTPTGQPNTATPTNTPTRTATNTAVPTSSSTATATPTITNTPIVTATPTVCYFPNPIQNPGFETGQLTPWVIDGFNSPPAVTTAQAHSGTYSVLVGSDHEPEPDGNSSLYQQVTVPPTGGTLSFWYYPGGAGGPITFDFQDAYVTDLNGNILAVIMHTADYYYQWTQKTFDMTPYAGQTVRIKFLVYEDGFGDLTFMYVDDVAIQAPGCITVTPSPTPLSPTTTHTNTPPPTNTSTNTPVPPTFTHTATPTNTNTNTPLPTQTPGGATATNTPTETVTGTPPAATETPTAINTLTTIATSTVTATGTPTATSLPTQTPGGSTATATPMPSDTPTAIPTNTSIATDTATAVVTNTSTETVTGTPPVVTQTPTACTLSFEDVPIGSTFYPYIQCLACRGIINGYPCGGTGEPCNPANDPYFRPGNNVTRGQFSKIASNSAGFQDPVGPQQYEDVLPGATFYDFIWRLTNRGLVNGYPCGGPGEPCGTGNLPYFRPSANVTRGQLSKIDSNAAGYNDTPTGQQYEDVLPGATFYDFIWRLSNRGIINGYPCGGVGEPCGPNSLPYFRSGANATRGQASKIVSSTFFPSCTP